MRSPLNSQVPLADEDEFPPLQLGPLQIWPPVVLAPMAGVTNAPFRSLCRQFSGDRCLYVSEMITAHSFVAGHQKTRQLASFGADEKLRSTQLYSTDAKALGLAARILTQEMGVGHIDINLGCPVRKITGNGGGSAIPLRPRLMARLVGAVVENAGTVPVTVKFRKGIDDQLLTFMDAGRVAQEQGCAAVALHARTAAQLYSGEADWQAVGQLKQSLQIPVLGNGDIFEAFDALRMMRQTGCDGVVVGRGCLGRPWLFADLVRVFAGQEPATPPNLGEVMDIACKHAQLLADFFGEGIAMQQMRKHMSWYTKSFAGMSKVRPQLQRVSSLAELQQVFAELPRDLPFPEAGLRVKRGKDSHQQTVRLPHGFLQDRQADHPHPSSLTDTDSSLSGG